ncbi:HIRA-interacting protein 3 isoform X1 [Fukomys damarensis]|uniref:HIRA-interacting protein 3 n=2 Tax=Fukomys damarensis TaxID=885580 RepID=A0A091DVY9_FUKDA|nr:HIRA-interacting protein 3 isoform X1 [Fukomys damarensis]KFO36284.1 HIRA-interacting protein 3 [Fukomys damarensis]
MARENELREFTHCFFRGRPDLSTLTHSIVRRKFLAHTGRNHLEPEEKQALKRLVEEELLKMQMDEAGTGQEKADLTKKVKRPPTHCSVQERKRLRFSSESASRSLVSSQDCFECPAKNGMAEAEIIPAKEEHLRQASKKAVKSSDEEQQGDQPVKQPTKMRLDSSEEEEEGEGSVRIRKILKAKDSQKDEEEKECKRRSTKKRKTKNEQAPGKTSASKQQTREESEDSEEEPVQSRTKKSGGKREAKSHEESEESEVEECLATKKENMGDKDKQEDEGEDWKPRARSKGGQKSALEGKSCKQESRAGRLSDLGDSGEEREAAGNGDSSGGGREPPVHRKGKDRTQGQGRKRQNRSSEDEDSCKVQAPAQGSAKTAKLGSASGEESDSEREISDSEAGGRLKGERKNHSSKKSSKKGRTRSSSSDGSPEPKSRKASSGRHGEDHPAVTRLKRYIRACGAHRNYKKLLGSCCSHKERLSVLRAELEALGLKGNPSLEKCRALKEQREEAAEVASLDVANIISSSGRPHRRTAWNPSGEAALSEELYRRTLDSEEERPRQAPPDWSHMRGIISSDGESN